MDKQAQFTSKLLQLGSVQSAARSVEDIRFIRDRLHERFAFFRVWPPLLQQLLCQLAVSQRWVQNQVLLSTGQTANTLWFIITGKVGICVRSPPSSSNLSDVTSLGPGDTCGEAALLGAPASSTVLVVRSLEADVLAVDVKLLAERLQALLASPGSLFAPAAAAGGSSRARACRSTAGGAAAAASLGGQASSPSAGAVVASSCGGNGGAATHRSQQGSIPGDDNRSSSSSSQPSSACSPHGNSSRRCTGQVECAEQQSAAGRQPSAGQPGAVSRKWGDLQVLTDTSVTKTAAELFNWIGCKPPAAPDLLAPPGAQQQHSPGSNQACTGGAGASKRRGALHMGAAGQLSQQPEGCSAVGLGGLERKAQLQAVSALEQQAASSWRQGTTRLTASTARETMMSTSIGTGGTIQAAAADNTCQAGSDECLDTTPTTPCTAVTRRGVSKATSGKDSVGASSLRRTAGAQQAPDLSALQPAGWVHPALQQPRIHPGRVHGCRVALSQSDY